MAQINYELAPRSYELIRDRVGLVLADELQLQAAVSYEDLFLANVFVQRSKPVQIEETPVICVSIDKGTYDNHTVIDSDGEFLIFIDCYTTGSYTSLGRGDVAASKDAQRLAGVVEAILANPIYKTLGFAPPFIMRSKVMGFEPAIIERGEESNLSVVRVTLQVKAAQTEIASDPINEFTTQTQVTIYNTELGYLYSGTGSPAPPAPSCAPAFVVNSNGEFFREISSGSGFELPDTPVILKDPDGNIISTDSVPSVSGGDIIVEPVVCEPVDVYVGEANVGSFPSGSDVFVKVMQDGFEVIPADVTVTDDEIDIILEDTPPCADATVNVNGNLFDTVTSGGTLNVPVVNEGTNPVGTITGGEVVIANSDVFINTIQVGDIPAEDNLSIAVTLDGVPSGTWNAGTQTWEVVGIPCADTTIEVNGTTEGAFTAGSTIDVQLSDSLGVVTPDSVTVIGNDIQVVLPDAPVTGWVRPTDWLAIPSTVTGEQVFYGLIAVQNVTLGNFVAFSFAGNYTVDWGDGSALENVNSGVTAQHQYDWANVSNITSEGFRQALIKVTPQAGQNLTNINLQKSHSTIGNGKTSQFIDMVMSLPNVTGANQTIGNGTFVYHRRCQRVWIKEMGSISVGTGMFSNFNSLQNIPLFNTASITLMNSMFSSCISLTEIPFIDTSICANMNGMFGGCYSLAEIPLLVTSSVTDMTNMFNACITLKTIPLLNTASVTSMVGMFSSCNSLQYLPLLNTTLVTSMNTMFLSCTALESIPAFNTAALINTVNMFNACNSIRVVALSMAAVTSTTTMFGGTTGSLQKFTATGLTRGISLANNQMSADELNNFFTSLGTASGAQTITVTGNHGAATCTTSIATGKGFTVVI